MAKVGMEYVVGAKLTEAEGTFAPSYSGGKAFGPASGFNLTTTSNDIKDYGDDRVVETDVSLNTIGLSLEINEFPLALEAELLGHDYEPSTKTMTIKSEDQAPFFGVGFVGKSVRDNVKIYRAVFLYRAQFSNPNDENSTKQESTAFNHTTLEGTAYTLQDGTGRFCDKAEFTSLDEARAWLNEKVGISA